MKLNDVSLGLVVLAGGIAILVSAFQFTVIPGQSYGADTMPKVIGGATIILGLVLVAKGIIAGGFRLGIAFAPWARSPASLAVLALAIGLIVAYIAASPHLGFLVTAFLIQAALMLSRGVKPLPAVAVAVVATVVIQQAFGRLLLVPLPRSGVFDVLW